MSVQVMWRIALITLLIVSLYPVAQSHARTAATSLLHVLDSSDLIVVASFVKGSRLPDDKSSPAELTLNVETVIAGDWQGEQIDVSILRGRHPTYKRVRIGPYGNTELIYEMRFVTFLFKLDDRYIWHFTAWDIGPGPRVDESSRLAVYGYDRGREYAGVGPRFVTLHQLIEYAKVQQLTYRFSGDFENPRTKLKDRLEVEVVYDGTNENRQRWYLPSAVKVTPSEVGHRASFNEEVTIHTSDATIAAPRYVGKPTRVDPMTGVIQVDWSYDLRTSDHPE